MRTLVVLAIFAIAVPDRPDPRPNAAKTPQAECHLAGKADSVGVAGLTLRVPVCSHGLSGCWLVLTPVVALTAFAMREDRERLLAAGFDGYVSKPIEIRAFLEQVQQFCSQER